MAVAFFIVAHSDDWFLFMGNAGVDAVGDGQNGNTICFVYVTASNAIDGTGALKGTKVRLRHEAGLRLRENATIAAALSMFKKKEDFPPGFPAVDAADVLFDVKEINGHEIAYYEVFNTRHYCLRLADGGVAGDGVAWTGNQSLQRLRNGLTSLSAQGDIPALYADWNDLTDTLRAIFDGETAGQQCWLNYLDPVDAAKPFPDGHSDHRHVGLAVQDATAGAANYDHALFRGYTIRLDAENLDNEEKKDKRALINAWDDVQKTRGMYDTIQQGAYLDWAKRQYRA
jgi:hypothetical protein